MTYKTLKKAAWGEFVEKKSRFIGYAAPVENERQALEFVAEVKSKNKEATHNCYAYTVRERNMTRYSDDGEPHGTAGMPILSVLQGLELSDAAVVVTRYFGGTLLGKGGLVRAYTEGAKLAVEAAQIAVMGQTSLYSARLDYSFYDRIASLVSELEGRIEDANFGQSVELTVSVAAEKAPALEKGFTEFTCGRASLEFLCSRFSLMS